MPDLSFDESGGTEFSLILFSFSKECLTGNHHRSKHAGVPWHRDFQGTQDRVGVGECEKYQDMPRLCAGGNGSLHGNGKQLEDLSLLQVRTGPGCRDGKSSQHHQDPRILSTWDMAWEAYLGPQAFSCRSPTPRNFTRASLFQVPSVLGKGSWAILSALWPCRPRKATL